MTILQFSDVVPSTTNYQKQTWKSNRNRIISILNQRHLTFTELIRESRLSRAVVNQHLKKLEEEGIIKKEYVEGRILNVLQPHERLSVEGKKSVEPVLFAVNALPYILGLKMHWEQLGWDKWLITIGKEKENLKERMEAVGRRLGVFHLFVLLKALEENNSDWLEEAGKLIRGADFFVWNSLDLSRNETAPSAPQKRISEVDGDVGLVYVPKVDELPKKEEISKLKSILEQIFPEEIKELEDVLRGQKNYEDVTLKN